MGWSFLIGFASASPFSVLAARARPSRSLLLHGLWLVLAFTAYFWISGLLPAWKLALVREQ